MSQWISLQDEIQADYAGVESDVQGVLGQTGSNPRRQTSTQGYKNWSHSNTNISVKLQPWFLSLRWKTCFWVELRPWCMSLQWKASPWAELSDDDMLKNSSTLAVSVPINLSINSGLFV